jgi:thioesterase domain-containing protein
VLAVARMQAGGVLPAGAQPSHVKGILNVTRAQAGACYQPRRTAPMPLVVFCATERGEDTGRDLAAPIDDASLGWSALLSGLVIAHRVPGSHATLVREPHVATLAEILRQHLGPLSSGDITA